MHTVAKESKPYSLIDEEDYSIRVDENTVLIKKYNSPQSYSFKPRRQLRGKIIRSSYLESKINWPDKSDKIKLNIYSKSDQSKDIPIVNELKTFTENKSDILREVLSFKSLVENWDGHGGLPLEIQSAYHTIELILRMDDAYLTKISDLHPNPNGTITIIWSNRNLDTLSLEIGNSSMSYYLAIGNEDPDFFDDIKINNETIIQLNSFIERI